MSKWVNKRGLGKFVTLKPVRFLIMSVQRVLILLWKYLLVTEQELFYWWKVSKFLLAAFLRTQIKLILANFGLKIRLFWDSGHENWYSYFSRKWKAFCENDLHQITYLTKSFLGTKNEGNWFSTLAIGWLSLLKPIYRSRAFSVAAPEHWNKLPDDLSSCENLSLFRHKLKIYTLF